jgi:catechol 2,3-dioxygenase-like lactoylglutathione lyase family enzyme
MPKNTDVLSVQQSDHASVTFEQAMVQFAMPKLTVTDIDRSFLYYTNLVGLKEMGRLETREIREILLTRTGMPSEFTFVLLSKKDRNNNVSSNGVSDITFLLPDVRSTVRKIESAGFDVVSGPVDAPSPFSYASAVTFAFVKDPDGYVVELAQLHR